MLEIGYNSNFEIRTENVIYQGKEPLRIVYLSDLHFNGFSAGMANKLIKEIKNLAPNILLLGGDYIDTKKGLVYLHMLLQSFSCIQHVFAVAGNHDHFFGLDGIKYLMQQHNVQWIEESSANIVIRGCKVRIDSSKPDLKETGSDLRILCLHKPVDPAKFPVSYHLAFAGHLHGSQCVLWQTKKGLFPGRLFYKWNILKTETGTCLYYISKGLGDTLPLRFNCRKEILVVDLQSITKQTIS